MAGHKLAGDKNPKQIKKPPKQLGGLKLIIKQS